MMIAKTNEPKNLPTLELLKRPIFQLEPEHLSYLLNLQQYRVQFLPRYNQQNDNTSNKDIW